MAIKSYDSYTSRFKNPYHFSGSVDVSDTSNLLYKRMMEERQSEMQNIAGRSLLDRGFDTLLAFNYASAGLADGIVKMAQGEGSFGNALKQMGKGFLAGNPFGDGDASSEYSYSQVLETAGWKPTSGVGKFAKGAVGFIGDVLFDPTTYLTLGGSAALKGTGRAGKAAYNLSKVADEIPEIAYKNTVDRLVSKGVSPERATKFAERKMQENIAKQAASPATHMTQEMAKEIVERQSYERGFKLTDAEIARDADLFAKKYNKLAGIDVPGVERGITFGVENLPFGDKLAPKLGKFGKTIRFTDGQAVREIGDKLRISNAYSAVRDKIYGSKIGNLFSTNSKLYKLGKEKPAELYSFVKFIDTTKGQAIDKLAAEKSIRDMAKAMNFTPEESTQIIKFLEDKTVWSKVKDNLKFAETQKAKELSQSIRAAIGKTQVKVDELIESKRMAELARDTVKADLATESNLFQAMKDKYREEITKIDLDLISDKAKKKEIIEGMRAEVKEIDEQLSTLKKNNGVTPEELEELVKKADAEQLAWDEHAKLRESFKDKKIKQADASEGNGNVVKEQKQTHIDHETIADVVNKSVDDELFKMAESAPTVAARTELVDKLSQYIYGTPGKLTKSLRGDSVNQLVKKVKQGASPEQLERFIEENAHLYSQHAAEVYRFVAKKYNYSSWKETYHEPMEELTRILKTGGNLSEHQLQKYLELQTLRAKRSTDIDYLLKRNSFESFQKYRQSKANEQMIRELEDVIDIDLERKRSKFIDDDSAQEKYKVADSDTYKQVSDILTDTARTDMLRDAITHFVAADNRVVEKYGGKKLGEYHDFSPNQLRGITRLTDSMEKVLVENFPGKAYSDLSQGQKAYLMNMAAHESAGKSTKLDAKTKEALVKEAKRRESIAKIEAIVDTVKPGMHVTWNDGKRARETLVVDMKSTEQGTQYTVKVGDETREIYARDVLGVRTLDKKRMTPDDLITASPIANQALEKRTQLLNQISTIQKELSELDGKYAQERAELFEFFKVRADEQKKIISELEDKSKLWDDTYQSLEDTDELIKLQDKIKMYEDALANDEALEIFVEQHMGKNYIDDVLNEANFTNSARIALDNLTDSERIKRWTETLFEEFKNMGAKEVGIGKLKKDQFEAMLGGYVPHILTPEGRRYIDSIKELKEHKSTLTKDLGYGNKWNPYSKSRTIEGKTIEEINKYFEKALKGNNLFSENIADIYLTRALKHNELIYDNLYMNTMMQTFGKVVTDGVVEDGYKAVANIGILKNTVADLVRTRIGEAARKGVQPSKELWDKYTKLTLRDLKLPSNILDEIATPMIELNGEQIAKIQGHGIVYQVSDVIVDKANQVRKLRIAKDQSRFLKLYDKFLHWTKLMQTTVMPSFHVRNKASNMYLNWLGVGSEAVNLDMQKNAWRTVWHLGDAEKLKNMPPLIIDKANGVPGVIHWNDLYELAKSHNVIDEGFFAKDVGAGAATKGLLKRVPSKYDPTDTKNFFMFKKGAEWGTRIENSDRLIHFAAQLKNGKTIEEAAESSKQFLFDYSDLTAFEQSVMKRIIPYYTWLRKNGKLQVEQFVKQPDKYRDTGKVIAGINNSNNSEDRVDENYLAEFARDWIQTPFSALKPGNNPNGERNPILANPNLPFMDISRLPNPFEPANSARGLLSQTSPAIKLPIELLTNTNLFFGNEIVGENDNPVTPTLAHIARQLALYNAGEGVATKTGVDAELHILNSLTGLKGIAYDEDTQMRMAMKRLMDKREQEASR